MADSEIRPEITAKLAHRKAASDCCGALLAIDVDGETYLCRGCGQPCTLVLGDPIEVTAHG